MFSWKAFGEVLLMAGLATAFITFAWGLGDASARPDNPAWHYFVSFGVATLLAAVGNGLSEDK